ATTPDRRVARPDQGVSHSARTGTANKSSPKLALVSPSYRTTPAAKRALDLVENRALAQIGDESGRIRSGCGAGAPRDGSGEWRRPAAAVHDRGGVRGVSAAEVARA